MQIPFAHLAGGPLEPLQPLAAGLAAAAYFQRVRHLSRQGRPVPLWRQLAFYSGLTLIVATLVSPIGHVSQELLFAHMIAQPAKKLLFMGCEIAQRREWNHDTSLDWHLLDSLPHAELQRWVEDLNKAYWTIPALHELDFSPEGFEWIDCCDSENSVVSLVRKAKSGQMVAVALSYTPVPRHNYAIGVPRGGHWIEVLNSDAKIYGGSGQGNMGGVDAAPIPLHGRKWSVNLTLPPLGAVFLLSEA